MLKFLCSLHLMEHELECYIQNSEHDADADQHDFLLSEIRAFRFIP